MKTIGFKKCFFALAFVLMFFASTFFGLVQKTPAFALTGTVGIIGPNTIDLNKPRFELVARISGSHTYDGSSIDWFYTRQDGEVFPALSKSPATDRAFSLAEFSTDNLGPAGTEVVVTAYINGTNYKTTHVMLVTQASVSHLKLKTPLLTSQPYKASGDYLNFRFDLEGNYLNEQVTWLQLEASGKFLPVRQGTTDKGTYMFDNFILNFKPKAPGHYTFVAKVGNEFSNQHTVTVEYKSIHPAITINSTLLEKNNLGLNRYLFEVVLKDTNGIVLKDAEGVDVSSINWYRKGFNASPLQYGGTSYILDPTYYADYEIYAKFEGASGSSIQSNNISVSIKVDRTKEILTYAGIAIGVMAIALIITIRRTIKRDRVW